MIDRRHLLVTLPASLVAAARSARGQELAVLRPLRLRGEEVIVVDSSGRRRPFWADVVADKLVVLNPIFTQCSSLCPLTNAVMAELQDLLAAELGDRLRLVSLGIDPFGDTAPALSAMARELGAGPHWLWIRADPPELDRLLRLLAAGKGRVDDHPPLFLVLDGRTREALRTDGIPPADRLAALVRGQLARRPP
jgi:protein SCO1/2